MPHVAFIAIAAEHPRNRISELVGSTDNWEIAQLTDDGRGLLSRIDESQPDLAFVGLCLSEIDPLELTRRVTDTRIVLVAPDDRSACRAFEAGALDYLVPPIDRTRFELTLFRYQRFAGAIESPAGRGPSPTSEHPCSKIVVWENSHGTLFDASSIDWIEAVGNYVKIHTATESHYLRENIGSLAERLDPDHFARIHRSTIVNLDRIAELVPASHGDLMVRLDSGRKLKMTRFYRKRIDHIIGKV